ncbi:hypothetical protein A0H81_05457 [Grifola frondosa]|uniref:Polymerase beta nucleotidyltransferase domain-containing protein n=1 Tax=Grifola frondosa TaxID=5627 RepID=A0A1C7MF79_GRIFR|nr:hypothetical protein A0H81_05457 [Grifola frondosa]
MGGSQVPTFNDMRQRMERVWLESPGCEEYVQWAGIFGSIARGRAREGSDVDVLVVFKDHIRSGQPVNLHEDLISACGRDVSLMCIWRGPDWAWGHVRVEALLASRTVYGSRSDVEDLRRDAQKLLQEGLKSVQIVSSLVDRIRFKIESVKTFEIALRHDCLRDLRTIVTILDIHPDWHALRTMLTFDGVEVADELRPSLFRPLPDDREVNLPDEDHQFWKYVWDHLQESSTAMQTFRGGASWGPKCVEHMFSQMKIAEAFDHGEIPDPTLYQKLVR